MGVRENRGREVCGRWEKKGREAGEKFTKASVRYFITAYHPVKNTNPATFLDFHLTFSETSNKILYARKCKFVFGLRNKISFGEIGNLLSHLRHWS